MSEAIFIGSTDQSLNKQKVPSYDDAVTLQKNKNILEGVINFLIRNKNLVSETLSENTFVYFVIDDTKYEVLPEKCLVRDDIENIPKAVKDKNFIGCLKSFDRTKMFPVIIESLGQSFYQGLILGRF
jgi:hypothetical protein